MRQISPGFPLRFCAILLWVAVADFAITALVLQVTRTDLNPISMPLSAYLRGEGGAWLRCAYYLMACALAALAWASYRATRPDLRSGLVSVLFFVAALALPVVAATELYMHGPQGDLARVIHGRAAETTFLCLTVGMILLSSRWLRDPLLRSDAYVGLAVACMAFVQLMMLAFWRVMPEGITQKLLIALILLWLAWASQRLNATSRRHAKAVR
ncbi:DUF998 domain-containing protein [Dyella sp. 20L07]|uniref:DUF998 domain-containing protein n=1 Tax=Dyella sp. 20L07 TaxID=3384240 RepID=UPI003D276BF2